MLSFVQITRNSTNILEEYNFVFPATCSDIASFHTCIETLNKFEYSIDIVKKQSFDKFITQSHILDELIVHTIHTNCVDELVAWVFDEIHDKSESFDVAIDS